MTKSKPENQKTKVMNDSKSKSPTLQILKKSEPNKQVLKKTESETQKPRFQRKKAIFTKSYSKTKGSEPKVYVPNPDHERGRNCGIWRKPNWQNHWYWNNW